MFQPILLYLKAYDEGAELAGLSMSGNRQALQSLIDEYVKNSGDIKDLITSDGFTYKQRFIGGYLGSNENVPVGEQGPEMLISRYAFLCQNYSTNSS